MNNTIDQLYTDFTTKLLPKIAEGFTITKEYFVDLFGRYAHFLFIQDVIYAIVGFLFMLLSIWVIKKSFQKGQTDDGWDEVWPIFGIIFGGAFAIGMVFLVVNFTMNAVKDKYIPEVRIYEELKGFIK